MKFIATTSDKISGISVVSGQLIFSRDDRIIYLDSDIGRTSFASIITLIDDEQRKGISPVTGFYFVEETAILWRYETSKGWTQLTKTADERLFFGEKTEFPSQGKVNTLYCAPDALYQWDAESNEYKKMGSEQWGSIA